MMRWVLFHPKMTPEMLGLIPSFLSESDPRPAREQFDENYQHGGGWRPLPNFTEIGQRLIAVKEKLGHGARLPWLDREFGWSEQAIAVAVERATQLLSHDNDALRREPEPLHP